MVDIMAKRPRLNLDSTYFGDSYDLEIEHMWIRSKLIREIIDF